MDTIRFLSKASITTDYKGDGFTRFRVEIPVWIGRTLHLTKGTEILVTIKRISSDYEKIPQFSKYKSKGAEARKYEMVDEAGLQERILKERNEISKVLKKKYSKKRNARSTAKDS